MIFDTTWPNGHWRITPKKSPSRFFAALILHCMRTTIGNVWSAFSSWLLCTTPFCKFRTNLRLLPPPYRKGAWSPKNWALFTLLIIFCNWSQKCSKSRQRFFLDSLHSFDFLLFAFLFAFCSFLKIRKENAYEHFSFTRRMVGTFCLLPSLSASHLRCVSESLSVSRTHAHAHTPTHAFWTFLAHLFIWGQRNISIFGYSGLQSWQNTVVRNSK